MASLEQSSHKIVAGVKRLRHTTAGSKEEAAAKADVFQSLADASEALAGPRTGW